MIQNICLDLILTICAVEVNKHPMQAAESEAADLKEVGIDRIKCNYPIRCCPAAALWSDLQWEEQTDSSITGTC